MNSEHQSRAIATIRPLLPPDAEDRVKRLVKHANAVVREQIRSETGLRMVDPDGAVRAGAPVSVVDGFSPAFAGLVAENPDPVLWALVSGPMAGILLYTAASDSEGTLGGLVQLGDPTSLGRQIHKALEALRICGSDPICSEHPPTGDGRGIHGASCHACLFAPETSCEKGNRYLDRNALFGTFAAKGVEFFPSYELFAFRIHRQVASDPRADST
jgi:hypothetical protein